MVITLLFILLLVSGLAFLFLKKRNKKIKISNTLNKPQHYYMFNLDKYNFLIYVTSSEKMQDDKIQSIKYTIIEKLNITEDVSKEIGVSYLGYISETEFKSKN